MVQTGKRLCLREELVHFLIFERRVQDFERRIAFQIDMFAEIDLSEAPSPKQSHQAIIA